MFFKQLQFLTNMKYKKYNTKFDFAYCFGYIPIIELLKSDHEIEEIFISTKLQPDETNNLKRLTAEKRITCTINNRLIEKISFKENTLAVAAFRKYNKQIDRQSKQIVLINPSNPGNLGTILRSMHAFGFKNLAIIKPAVDIYMPKVISASMGSFFNINIQYFDDLNAYLKSNELPVYILDSNAKEIFSKDLVKDENYVLMFGNESTGIPDYLLSKYNSFKINQSNEVESLNLGISLSIVLSVLYN